MKPVLVKVMVAMAALTGSAWAQEEGPGRGVARISVINGDVSVRRGDDTGEWIAAAINAPLVVEDRVFSGPQSRAELQFDYANMVRLDENTEVRLAGLEDQRYQVQIARGTVMFRVLRDSRADVELSTPSVSVRPVRRGSYRVTVREDGSSEITVRSGEVEVYTPRGAERLTAGRTMLARGSATDPEFQLMAAIRMDDWDRWNDRRDHDLERTRSYQYVSPDVYGAEDLDGSGDWEYAAPYGWVWAPRVAPGWAPYRYGRWTWIDWYGWTWVSYDPWGWAPYHYGRWFYGGNRWCWWPGALHGRHYWSPALVAFFGWGHHGGFGVGVGFGNVGWVPLAPYEPFHPWYGGRYYAGFRNRTMIDNSVRVVNNINITNVYRNARVINGVTAVNSADFTRGHVGNFVRVSDSDLRGAGLVRGQVPLAPDRSSLRLTDRDVRAGAVPRTTDTGRFFSRRQPAAVDRVTFDDQRRGMEQVSRRTFGETRPADAAAGGRNAAVESRGVGGTGRVTNAETQRNAEQPARSGWRRSDEGTRTDAGTVRTESLRPAESSGSRSQSSDQSGWRRFEGGSRTDTPSRATEAPSRSRNDAPTRTDSAAPSRRESRNDESWRRFNQPSVTPETRGTDSGVRRSEPAPRVEQPRVERQRVERQNVEPLRISPPIVRERSMPRSESGGGGFSRGSESRPQMSAPTPRGGGEVRSGGGGGNRGGGESHGGGGSRGGGRGR